MLGLGFLAQPRRHHQPLPHPLVPKPKKETQEGRREGRAAPLSPVGEDLAVVEDLDLQDLVPIDVARNRPAEGLGRKDGEMSGWGRGEAAGVMRMGLGGP